MKVAVTSDSPFRRSERQYAVRMGMSVARYESGMTVLGLVTSLYRLVPGAGDGR